ncbi:MAG TPA: hypothetical protein GXZ76_06275 [Clostridiaceae bacterium]|nr:hypothetical protein [Clostridiaceae bacterium]
MDLFKKKNQALAGNEHYTLRCKQCGQEVVNIPGEHTPEMQYYFHPKTMGVVSVVNGRTITYGGFQEFFTLQVSADQSAKISTTLADCIVTIHEHLVSHNKPLYMLVMDILANNTVSHTYFAKKIGSEGLEYHGFDFGILHDRGRDFEINPNLWASVVVAASPNIKIKGFPMGTDYSKAVLPGIHLKRQVSVSMFDYQEHVTMAVNDLSAMCGTAVLGGTPLEKNRDYIRNLGKELYNAHGMKAMQDVFFTVTERYPVLCSQLSSIWNGVGDWAD